MAAAEATSRASADEADGTGSPSRSSEYRLRETQRNEFRAIRYLPPTQKLRLLTGAPARPVSTGFAILFGAESAGTPCVDETACAHLGIAMLSGEPLHWPCNHLSTAPPRMSPLQVLTQHPVPVIAVAENGVVVFANTAFADFLSCSCDAVTSSSYEDIASFLPPDEILLAVTRLGDGPIGRVLQLGQATLFVKIHRSATSSATNWSRITRFEGLLIRLSTLA
jgi:hypothetical protein